MVMGVLHRFHTATENTVKASVSPCVQYGIFVFIVDPENNHVGCVAVVANVLRVCVLLHVCLRLRLKLATKRNW